MGKKREERVMRAKAKRQTIVIENPLRDHPLSPLRVYPGWAVVWNKLKEIEPETLPTDDLSYWMLNFVQNTTYLKFQYDDLLLDLGWYPEGDPAGAWRFELIRGADWFDPVVSVRTRSTEEVNRQIELITRDVSMGKYSKNERNILRPDLTHCRLQPLRTWGGWFYRYNNFSAIHPQQIDIEDKNTWSLFNDKLLRLEGINSTITVHLGWYPNHDPHGHYWLRVIRNSNWNQLIWSFTTRDLEEIVEIMETKLLCSKWVWNCPENYPQKRRGCNGRIIY